MTDTWRCFDQWDTKQFPAVGKYRHLVDGNHPTSACGTTALPASMWLRKKSKKPKCPECLAAKGDPDEH